MTQSTRHEPDADTVQLTAADVLHPAAGEVLEVLEGQVLVFALDTTHRRIPMSTVEPGAILVGCEPTSDGLRLLVTGLPGTLVRRRPLDDTVSRQALSDWITHLWDAATGGRWPRRLVTAERATMLAPGEHIGSGAARSEIDWVHLTSGTATMVGEKAATVGPLDPDIPLTANAWLTSGLRCRVSVVDAPHDLGAWSASLSTLCRLCLQVVVARRSHRDQHCAQRLESRALQSAAASEEAVDVLSAAVGGKERIPVVTDEKRSTQLAAAVEVARHTGLPVDDVSLTRAADEVESGRDPLTAVAAACGARIRTVTLAQRWWQTEGNPLIVMLRDESRAEVAQAAVWRRGWVLIDPLSGKQQPITEELAERIERKATELLPVLPAAPTGIRQLARLALRGSRREIIAILAVTALLAAMSFVTPFLMGQIANLFIASSPRSAYVGLFGAMLLVVIAGISWQAVRALAMLRARSQAAAVSAGAVWERVMRQRATWHSQRSLGDRSAQASAVNNASAALPDETVARLLDTAAVLGSLAAIATTGSAMLVSLTAVLAGQMLVMLWLLRAASKRASQRVEAAAEATGRLMELLRAVNRLRVAGAEARAFLRWAQVQAPFSRADQSLRRITMLQGVVIAMWPVLALVVVVWVTAATSGSFGGFVTAQTAAATATTAIAAMALSANGTLVARQSLLKARPALESVPEGGGQGSQPGVLSGGMEVRELVFRYAPDLPTALDHVTFTVRPGEHVAIIGPSGCGKTTLMRILLGLEDPESGVISVDGKDLASLDRPAVRRQIGSVLQSSTLLPCTIKENIDMGRAMSHEEVWAALDAAAVGDDIRAMAMGLDTPVTDGGGTLSGGQRQRILIARALAGSPRMLILDEATSALDNLTQAAVVDALNGLRITRIVVAHRLSTVREADRIIVMDKGRVVDEGSYDALMAKDGPFRELALRQQA